MINSLSVGTVFIRQNQTSTYVKFCRAEALVQWLKLPVCKLGDHGFEPSSLQVSRKQDVSSPLTSKYSILWGASSP